MKRTILPIILFIALAISISGCYAGPKYSPELKESFVLAKDWKEARENIENNGGRIRHIFPDKNILIGEVPDNFRSKNVRKIYDERSVVPSTVKSEFLSWKNMLDYKSLSLEEKLANIPSVEPIYNDMVLIEKPSLSELDTSIPLPIFGGEATDTSSFFIGDVGVNVIFPESTESTSNTEDWTDIEIQEVKDEILNSMDWWAVRETDAHLTFMHYYEERIPVDLEPIEHESYYDWQWINDIMLNLGYGPEQYPPTPLVYNYLNNQREGDGCDWSFAIFVADSSNDIDGMFVDEKFAYTVYNSGGGGPYMIMTYDNQNYGIENMDAVGAHETGHIFGSIDQYGSCSCSNQVGYLYYENQNCMNNCLLDENSIMGNGNIITAFANGAIDYYARGQVGWQDNDVDNILDIVDTSPMINLDPYVQNDSDFIFDGGTQVGIFPAINPYYNDITVNTIANVDYSYMKEGELWGDWFSADAIDGLFDGPQELFEFILGGLPSGDYTIKARATNNEGNFNESGYQYITITGIPPLCSETDSGYDIFNYGYVTDDYGTYEDTCNGRILFEYYCDPEIEGVSVVEVNCKYGCSYGACGQSGPLNIRPIMVGNH